MIFLNQKFARAALLSLTCITPDLAIAEKAKSAFGLQVTVTDMGDTFHIKPNSLTRAIKAEYGYKKNRRPIALYTRTSPRKNCPEINGKIPQKRSGSVLIIQKQDVKNARVLPRDILGAGCVILSP